LYGCVVLFCAMSLLFFFFPSRRRHTRFSRDWSSDVCSSDLCHRRRDRGADGTLAAVRAAAISASISSASRGTLPVRIWCPSRVKIGRASCRERGDVGVGGGGGGGRGTDSADVV